MTLEALMTLPFRLGGVGGGSPGSACELPRPQLCVADDDDDGDDDDDDGDDHDGDDDDGGHDDDDDHDDNGDDDDDGDDDDHHDDNDDDDLSRSGQTIAFDRSFTKSKYSLKFIRSNTHVQKVYIHEDRFSTYNSWLYIYSVNISFKK